MRCAEVRALLAVRDELDATTDTAVAGHLTHCRTCSAALADEQFVLSQLRGIPIQEPPIGLESRLLALPTTASVGLAPALAERWIWMLLAAATAVATWGLWRAQLGGTDKLMPVDAPLVDAGAAADARGAGPSPLGFAVTGRAIATAVLRQRPIDLHRQPDLDVAAGVLAEAPAADGAGGPGGRGAPPGRGPRDSGAGVASQPPESDGGSGALPPAAAPPTPAPADARPAGRPRSATAAAPGVEATAAAPGGCAGTMIQLTVRVLADMAGGGIDGCPGCDGTFDALDRDALAASGMKMPVLQIGYYSRTRPDELVFERNYDASDVRSDQPGELTIELPVCVVPDAWPLVAFARILNTGSADGSNWDYCPTNANEKVLSGPDDVSFEVRIRPMCPVNPTPTASEPLSGPPTPAATPPDAPFGSGPEPPSGQVAP
ncbi:MAG: hypothetical protein U0470_09985 [Anaerolineae bacterium]